MLAVGLADDVRPMTPGRKLLRQAAVCSAYLLAVAPLTSNRFPGVVIELAFLLLVVNAFNLIDVMDGLLIVVAAAATIGLLGGSFLPSVLSQVECWALLASLAVAFWFNRPHARVFLGDAGALALGFFLGSLYLTGASASEAPGDLLHLAAFAVPAFELTLLTIARVRRRASPFRGSPDHFALRLQNQGGWTRGKVLLATAAIALTLDVWCHLPPDHIVGPAGIALAATSIVFGSVATVRCWRLEPPGELARDAVG
jgi:UDP-GlcNAc:undecaprenyl-phosphate GlcNAc-1-phosphate transferase